MCEILPTAALRCDCWAHTKIVRKYEPPQKEKVEYGNMEDSKEKGVQQTGKWEKATFAMSAICWANILVCWPRHWSHVGHFKFGPKLMAKHCPGDVCSLTTIGQQFNSNKSPSEECLPYLV